LESEISIEGQLLALADSVVAIYFNRFDNPSHDWRDVLGVIQLNAQEYFHRGVKVLYALLLRKELPTHNVVVNDLAPEFSERLLMQNLRLKNWFELLKDTLISLGYRHGDKRLHALQNIMLHIATSCKGAQIFDDDFKNILRDMAAGRVDGDMTKRVEDAVLLQQEIYYHLRRLSHMLDNYIVNTGHDNQVIQQKLMSCYKRITPYLN
jgi:hypothetical protein